MYITADIQNHWCFKLLKTKASAMNYKILYEASAVSIYTLVN